ncbi:unnamed protein product [Spirodela intermedia]|uniref:Uncharacterized protein n=1 Tax=Spirodela intermedia TaxID=51605 RepID=A0A7I8KVX9_SPIIN|nr:unnamed protein product [Spirodela intermedia]
MSPNSDPYDHHGKTATLRLSGGCHPTERSWMEQWNYENKNLQISNIIFNTEKKYN